MKKIELLIVLIFLTGFFLRIYPVLAEDLPLGYDSYFHIRIAEQIQETGKLPNSIPWPEPRPFVYPPLYHVILAIASIATGISVLDVTRFFLPIISSLFILATYFLVKKYHTKEVAVLASFFVALNPYLISNSYDSPQIIAMFLSFFFINWLLEKKYLQAGCLLALISLFSSMATALISITALLFLLWKKEWKHLHEIFIPLIIVTGAWYLFKSESLWCLNNTIAPYFLDKSLYPLLIAEGAIITVFFIILLSFKPEIRDDFSAFFSCLTIVSYILLMSFLITPQFHPWRQPFYIFFGISLLIPIFINQLRKIQDQHFLFITLTGILLLGLVTMFLVSGIKPALTPPDYEMIDWYDSHYSNTKLLAQHDVCSNLMTLTGKSCMLDIYFECIPDEKKWFDLENFYWIKSENKAKETLFRYNIDTVMFPYLSQNEFIMENISADKPYISWSFKTEPYQSSSFYELNR